MTKLPVTVMVLLATMLFSSRVLATVLYVPIVPGIFSPDGTGIFDKIILEASKRSGVEFVLIRQPYARAISSFARDKSSCFPVGNAKIAKVYLGLDVLAPREGYYNTKIVLATDQNGEKISDYDDLRGKRVVHLRGDDPARFGLDQYGAEFTAVQTHAQGKMMLDAGRADVIMGADTDMVAFLSELTYDPQAVIFSVTDSFMCHPQHGNEETVAIMAEAIETMKRDGTLDYLLGPLATARN